MKLHRTLVLITFAGLVAASSLLLGCGKSSSPTNPGGGIGGGGGGGGGGANTPFDSGTLTAPAAFSHAFPTAGTVTYHCNFHVSLGMVGTINISAAAADSIVNVTASGTTFSPSTITIKPGGIVHWNIASGTHTVTSD